MKSEVNEYPWWSSAYTCHGLELMRANLTIPRHVDPALTIMGHLLCMYVHTINGSQYCTASPYMSQAFPSGSQGLGAQSIENAAQFDSVPFDPNPGLCDRYYVLNAFMLYYRGSSVQPSSTYWIKKHHNPGALRTITKDSSGHSWRRSRSLGHSSATEKFGTGCSHIHYIY